MRMKKKSVDNRPTERKSINEPNEINKTVEIPLYAPNLDIIPKEYMISPQFNELEKTFRETCMGFLSNANPDEFNSTYMDAVIERMSIEAIKYIKVQRGSHQDLITGVLSAMHIGDYAVAQAKLQSFIDDKEEKERELRKYRRISWAGTSLSEED